MAELRAAVTDTHPLLFHAAGGRRRLGRRASRLFAACEEGDALIYVPAAVMWETSLLVRAGRIRLGRPLASFFTDLFSQPAYQSVDLTPEQVYLADEAGPNQDPFDRLICAAARHLGLPLISRDGDVQDFGLVRVVW